MSAPDHLTLLAHLGPLLGSSKENLATEALRFLLGRSPVVRAAFTGHVSKALRVSDLPRVKTASAQRE